MGSDYGPDEIIQGAIEAMEEYNQEVILVGDQEKIQKKLISKNIKQQVEIVHAGEEISMHDSPSTAVRRKKNSSLVKSMQLVKEGKAAAMLSAGNTGAVMASALLELGRIKGIDRPAIAVIIPGYQHNTVLLDAGANVSCKPQNLLQFGLMGYLYAEKILNYPCPKIGLLSIGVEVTKGNEITIDAYPLLQKANINFMGNVEGRDIFFNTVDVVVCDGFVGNVVLKTIEGMAIAYIKMIEEEIDKNLFTKLGSLFAFSSIRYFKKLLDYAEYGGAHLLGVNGVVTICHGSSSAKAIKNAIRLSKEAVEKLLVQAIQDSIEKIFYVPLKST
jgi:glycerol-3-phosphate acyltransferase PlsX